jgi:outer membrane protein OmpA-like peptidoglycan-associated protein
MKFHQSALISALLITPLLAQPPGAPPVVVESQVTETVSPGKKVVEEVVTETPVAPVAPAGYDPALTRRQLGMVPRALPVEDGTPAPRPGTTVETTETVTKVGGRVYNTERSVVIVEGRELPYITIPVLFVKETAELLDTQSRTALEDTALAIREIVKTDPTAKFDIEGHTSTDGADDLNMELSGQRARRVYQELTERYGVPAAVLSAHGLGENYPAYPHGTEAQMTLDRRVLVVRIK